MLSQYFAYAFLGIAKLPLCPLKLGTGISINCSVHLRDGAELSHISLPSQRAGQQASHCGSCFRHLRLIFSQTISSCCSSGKSNSLVIN